jgi:hypothetical protein
MGELVFIIKEFISIVHWTGFLGGRFYEGWTESSQYLIALLIGGLQEASCVSTLPNSIVGGRCSTSFRLVWDLGITLNFSLVQLVDHRVVMAFLEDCYRAVCSQGKRQIK